MRARDVLPAGFAGGAQRVSRRGTVGLGLVTLARGAQDTLAHDAREDDLPLAAA